MRQTSFLKQLGYTSDSSHGGKQSLGRRKSRRPLDPRHPVHLILRAAVAKGALSMLRPQNRLAISRLIHRKAAQFHMELQGFANVGNHLHIKVRFKQRPSFQKFLKSISAQIPRLVTGAKKGKPFGKFWDFLAYTKVVKVWTQEKLLDRYIQANNIEADHGQKARALFLRQRPDG